MSAREMEQQAGNGQPLRLGFAVKVLGRPDMPSNDARRWQSGPHLRVSLEHLRRIFAYLAEARISMYRLSSDLAPYLTHPDLPQFHGQLEECQAELAELGAEARRLGLRLSLHPSQFVVLNSPDEELVARSLLEVERQVELLDALGAGPEAVVVIHVGGVYGEREASLGRFVAGHGRLSQAARRRLVVENDDVRFTAADALWVHEQTGAPVVYDYLHHQCNPDGLPVAEALARCLATWPAGVRPKIHFSSPRTELKLASRRNKATGKQEQVPEPPQWKNHADYVNPFELIALLRQAGDRPFDVMLEAKAKDLALLRFREDLRRYAPELAPRFEAVVEQDGALALTRP